MSNRQVETEEKGCSEVVLSEEQLTKIVDMIFDKLYAQVGKGALGVLKWIGIVLIISSLAWLASMGKLKVPAE